MKAYEERPLLVVISAPSGAGKTTLCRRLLQSDRRLTYSVSCTTRPPRSGEREGVDYYFMTRQAFDRRARENAFLEHALVHDYAYGTLRSTVKEAMRSGRDVLMDIDVQGAAQVRGGLRALPADDPLRRGYVDIFVAPPSSGELRRRLEDRAADDAQVIQRRLRNATAEMERWREYRYRVVNDDLEQACAVLQSILVAERHRVV